MEQRRLAKEKAEAESSEEDEAENAPHDKSAPKAALPISNKAFGKARGKRGKAAALAAFKGKGKSVKPPPRKNLRKEQALAVHAKRGTLPIRRNRPKNWRQLRPDKPPPPRKSKAEEVGND